MTAPALRIAVLVPCFNEEAAVATVVADFRKALPAAEIFVYDNNSRDRTVEVARAAGAIVRSERRQGKGHVVRRMFADVDADIYVLVDGDATYDAPSAPRMIDALVNDHLDMVVGFRVDQSVAAYRPGHRTGNWMLTSFLSAVFGQAFKDILSGYRVFSRRFVKSFPVLSDGFEIETELSVHALELALPVAEIETPYYARPEGSFSKLNTWRDGFRILGTILKLYRSEKPLRFFTAIGVFLMLVSIGLAIPVIITYLEEGLVPRLPTAVLSMGLMIVAVLSVSSGLVLDTVTRGRREMKLLAYLSQPAIKRIKAIPRLPPPAMDRAAARCYPAPHHERTSLTILAETPKDAQAIERLHERTFGPGRFVLSAYRLREHVDHLLDLSFTARIGTLLVGSVRQLPICIGDTPALMLGPLTVEPPFRSRGVGRMLLDRALQDAKAKGHRLVILVGDEPYYSRVGFKADPEGPGDHAGPGRLQPPAGGGAGRGRLRRRLRRDPAGLEQGAVA